MAEVRQLSLISARKIMIIFSDKNIYKWAWWKNKSKLLFCIASGLVFAMGVTVLTFILKMLKSGGMCVTNSCLAVFGVSFVAGALFSIIIWHLNDDRFNEWLKKEINENPK
jgi:predicted membrane protein